MANYTADQLTQTTDPSAAAFACAPFAGGNSLFATVNQIVTYGTLAGGLQLPSNSGGAGYDLTLSAGDAGATGRGGNVYVKVGAQNTSGGNGSVIFLDQTGTQVASLGSTGIWTIAGALIMSTTATPASAAATGTTGQIAWDSSYIYVCTATNTWKRVAIATW